MTWVMLGTVEATDKRQAQNCASWQSDCTTHEQVQMIAWALLQTIGWPVHNHASQVLVQVSQDCKANRRNHGKGDTPCREFLLNTIRVHNPCPLLPGCQGHSRGEGSVNFQHPQGHIAGPDGCQGRCSDQGNCDCKVGHKVANRSHHPRSSGACRTMPWPLWRLRWKAKPRGNSLPMSSHHLWSSGRLVARRQWWRSSWLGQQRYLHWTWSHASSRRKDQTQPQEL